MEIISLIMSDNIFLNHHLTISWFIFLLFPVVVVVWSMHGNGQVLEEPVKSGANRGLQAEKKSLNRRA